MRTHLPAIVIAAALAGIPAISVARPPQRFTAAARHEAIRRAHVWMPTQVSHMDVRAGPRSRNAFEPNALVRCEYAGAQMSGLTRKFNCDLGDNDVVKVRYGIDNGEVQGSVLASRLLWALGFGADRVYPVRVLCRGCSADPWNDRGRRTGERLFDPAAIDLSPSGKAIETSRGSGWRWAELDDVDPAVGGASRAERDALTLLAVFIQHGDSKHQQQRLVCLPGAMHDNTCDAPFMLIHDVGNTFGRSNTFNRNAVGSVNFDGWSTTPVWRQASECRGNLERSHTGTIDNPLISEEGRRFLADLLVQLTDQQLHDLFEVSRVDLRSRRPGSSAAPASVDEWVAAFKHKRAQIVEARCPS